MKIRNFAFRDHPSIIFATIVVVAAAVSIGAIIAAAPGPVFNHQIPSVALAQAKQQKSSDGGAGLNLLSTKKR